MDFFLSLICLLTISFGSFHCLQFPKRGYEAEVAENKEVGSFVVQVQAKKEDEDPEGEIRYLRGHWRRPIDQNFQIDSRTGIISTRRMLDYERGYQQFRLHVKAILGQRSADTMVTVKLIDVNDNTPKIIVYPVNSHRNRQPMIRENSPPGVHIANMEVSDSDTGENGKVQCHADNPKFNIVQVRPNFYKILSAAVFDREEESSHLILIRCSDLGTPRRISAADIDVGVIDENDNSPTFPNAVYHASLSELNTIGAFVIQVRAEDRDAGLHGKIHYQISDKGTHQGFKIDKNTGEIHANKVFHYNDGDRYHFIVFASDLGTPSRLSSLDVVVEIKDINQPPKFTQGEYNFTIYENEPEITKVGNVHAVDPDTPPFNQFRYFITSGNESNFDVDAKTGEISSRMTLDRESKESYVLQVSAVDDHLNMLSDSAKVYIHVADKNDNSPVITFPNKMNNIVTLSARNLTKGSTILTVKAHDDDSGKNGKLSYHLINGEGLFAIECHTGNLHLNRSLPNTNKQSYTLTIMVKDCGEPSFMTNTQVEIRILPPQDSDCGCDE